MPPAEAANLTPAPVKGTVVFDGGPVEGEAAPDACICPSEIWLAVGNGAEELAMTGELAAETSGPGAVGTAEAVAGLLAAASVADGDEPAEETQSHTALAADCTARPV